MLGKRSCLFKAPLPIPSFLWLASPRMPDPAPLQQHSSHAKWLPNYPRGINRWNMWLRDIVWCHKVTEFKAGLLTRRFRSSVFSGRGELLLVRTWIFSTFKIFYVHKNICKTGEKKIQKKNNRSLLKWTNKCNSMHDFEERLPESLPLVPLEWLSYLKTYCMNLFNSFNSPNPWVLFKYCRLALIWILSFQPH